VGRLALFFWPMVELSKFIEYEMVVKGNLVVVWGWQALEFMFSG